MATGAEVSEQVHYSTVVEESYTKIGQKKESRDEEKRKRSERQSRDHEGFVAELIGG